MTLSSTEHGYQYKLISQIQSKKGRVSKHNVQKLDKDITMIEAMRSRDWLK